MKQSTILLRLIVAFIAMIFLSQLCKAETGKDITIGRVLKIKSKTLKEERSIMVSLPASYDVSAASYPVLYLSDAETHFNYTAAVVKFLSQNGRIPEMIVVGIPNTKRNRDYTAIKTEDIAGSGGADKFLQFLEDELIPKINKDFRTQNYKIFAGHSLCGMFCIYTLLQKPELFDSFIALSPWVIASNSHIIQFSKDKFPNIKSLSKQFYFTAGSLEGNDLLSSIDEFVNIIKTEAPDDFKWNYKLMEGEDHGSLVLTSIYEGLKYIFNGWQISASDLSKGLDTIMSHYAALSKKYGYEVRPTELILNNAGYGFLQNTAYDEALKIFKKNIELYPESANVYDSCGECFEKIGQFDNAKEYYSKAFNIAKKTNDRNLAVFEANYKRLAKAIEP